MYILLRLMSDILEKKVLILVDNEYLYREFTKIVQGLDMESVEFFYGCSPGNVSLIDSNLKVYNLKYDALDISKKFDLVISLHCKQIFPLNLIENIRCINIHPGYNPYNRGWYPHVFSILNKLPVGATIHEMDDKIDHGPIIAQEEVNILPTDDSSSLYNRVLQAELKLINENLKNVIYENYSVMEVPEGNINYKKDYEKLCEIDLHEVGTFGEFIDRLRCLTHDDYKNAYFIDENGRKIFIQIRLTLEG